MHPAGEKVTIRIPLGCILFYESILPFLEKHICFSLRAYMMIKIESLTSEAHVE